MHESVLSLLSEISSHIREVTFNMWGLSSHWEEDGGFEHSLGRAFNWPRFETVLARLTKLEVFICELRVCGGRVLPDAYKELIEAHLPQAYSRGIVKFVRNDSLARHLIQ